ncbi:MAG TPA: NAD kinase [Luteibaculaceae bacterium]|nr:NAD kinase [Luteibaculaceae bacterium]
MKIAIYGKKFNETFVPAVQFLFSRLKNQALDLYIHDGFADFLFRYVKPDDKLKLFASKDFSSQFDVLLSIGGDGTFLDAVTLVKQTGVPILGINTGRLGFLSIISREEISGAVNALINRDYVLEDRSLLSLLTDEGVPFGGFNFALNELTVIKKDTSSMITVQAYIDGAYLNSYWADGIIVATPTGSTAYSLSCGGPILAPTAPNFIITPIAPHNLNVRPIVLSDTSEIRLKVEARDENYLVALDSRSIAFDPSTELIIKKADFSIKLLKLKSENFYNTLRAKMMWGMDRRN